MLWWSRKPRVSDEALLELADAIREQAAAINALLEHVAPRVDPDPEDEPLTGARYLDGSRQ